MTEKVAILTALADSHLFGLLSTEALEAIADIAREVVVPPDTIMDTMGQTGKHCCLIVSGSVKMFRLGRSGNEVELVRLGPGESFGEAALLSDAPIPASIKTVEETRLIVLSKDRFDPIMREFPEVKEAVGQGVSDWFHRASSYIEDQSERRSTDFRLRWIDLAVIIGLSLLCALVFNYSNPKGLPFFPKSFANEEVSFITSSEVFEKNKKGEILMVDAMPSIFYEQEHILNTVNLPLAIFDFMYDMKLGKTDKAKEIVVYGRTISKKYDEEVAAKLVARGFKKVHILKGGLSAWKKNHYPVVS